MRKVLINVEERELRVAILEDDQLSELYVESLDNRTILNNIYRGRVEGIVPGLKAAFVNIGQERNAFLHFDDIRADLRYAPEDAPPVAGAEYVDVLLSDDDDTDDGDEVVAAAPQRQEKWQRRDDDRDDFKRRRRRGRRGGRRRHGGDDLQGGEDREPVAQPPQAADSGPGDRQPSSFGDGERQGGQYRDGGAYGGQQQDGGRRGKKRRKRGRNRDRDRGDRQPNELRQGNSWRERGNTAPPQPDYEDQPPPSFVPPGERPAIGTRAATNPFDVFSPYAVQKGRRQKPGRQAGPGNRESQEDFFGSRGKVPGAYYPPEADSGHFHDDYDGPAPGNELNPDQSRKRPGGGGGGRGRKRTMRRRGGSRYAARRKDDAAAPAKKSAKPAAAKKPAKKAASSETTVKKKSPKSATAAAKKSATTTKSKVSAAKTAAKPGARANRKEHAAETAKPKSTRRRKAAEVVDDLPVQQEPMISESVEVAEAGPQLAAEPRGRRRGQRGAAEKARVKSPEVPASQTPAAQATVARSITVDDLVAAPETIQIPYRGEEEADETRGRPPITPRGITPHDLPSAPPPAPRRVRRQLLPVTESLKKGDEIMVQVIKEEIGLKGARITSYVSIPGRYLVLLPYPDQEGGISRKVSDFQERKRLKRMLREIKKDLGGEHVGFIVRTAGVDREEHEIRSDVEFLLNEWKRVNERYDSAAAGEALYDDSDIIYRLARDVFDEDISEVLIDSAVEADKLKSILGSLIPSLVDKVKLYDEPENIFHKFQVERQIQKAGRRKVWLKSGGYLIIDEAEALTAIDVNTGKAIGKDDQEKLILKTNLEAARAIARELKLRDIGGIIVVDFIDMKDSRNRDQLLTEFRAVLRKDRSKTSVSGISEFGLVEMTRKRVRQSLRKTLFSDCPYCQGAGVVLNESQIWLHIKHEVVNILEGKRIPRRLEIVVNPKLEGYIDQNYKDVFARWREKYGVEVELSGSDQLHMENYAIERQGGETVRAGAEEQEAAEPSSV